MRAVPRVLPWVLLVAACSPAGASDLGDADAPGAEPVSGSVATLGTLPPGRTADTVVAADDRAVPDLVAIRGDGTVARVRHGRLAFDGRSDVAPFIVGLDGRSLVESVVDGKAVAAGDDGTEVRWSDLFTGDTTGRAVVRGAHLVPTATDTTGRFVALTNATERPVGEAIAPGRTSTTIVIADRESGERYHTTLDGNYHPEAFGVPVSHGAVPDVVYVLEYLPPEAPTHYRVRVLRTSTGELGLPVNLREKSTEVDSTMAGTSRTQVVSSHDGGLLFTLYRGVAGEGDRHGYAFVHTLGFDGGVWCLDIPPEMELDTQPGALVVAGDRLVVASANGTVGSYDIGAVLDPAQQPVMDSFSELLHPYARPVLTATDDRVWVAWANFVYELDPTTLEMLTSAPRQLADPVTALAVAPDGQLPGDLLMAHPDGTITSSGGASIDLTASGGDRDRGIVKLLVDDGSAP
jgi:hypothetical protein